MVLCDMKTRGGGWTYFLNRFDGTQDFYLNWSEYKNGFGNLAGEFWLGLDNLFELTGNKKKLYQNKKQSFKVTKLTNCWLN